MKVFPFLAIFALASITAQAATSEHSESINMQQANEVATKSIQLLRQLVTAENAKAMGFKSLEEARLAKTEPPIPVYMVQLDELRTYKKGDDVATLLRDLHQEIVPLSVNGQVRSSVIVEKVKNEWRPRSFGSPSLARLLSRAREAGAKTAGTPINSFFAVHIAALRTYFIAHWSGSSLLFTTVLDDAELNLAAGETIPADEALASLVPIAQRYNGLPM